MATISPTAKQLISDVPIPGSGVIAEAISFIAGLFKGKTQHATYEQSVAPANKWVDPIEASFNSTYSHDEQIAIAQKMQGLLMNMFQTRWGLNAQMQPALMASISGRVPSIRELLATMFVWAFVNVDSDSANEFSTVMQWGWNQMVVSGIQAAGLDPLRLAENKATSGIPGGVDTGATAKMGILIVLGIVVLIYFIARKGRKVL